MTAAPVMAIFRMLHIATFLSNVPKCLKNTAHAVAPQPQGRLTQKGGVFWS
jgi:hypothetical protein